MRSAHIECVLFITLYRALWETIATSAEPASGDGAARRWSMVDEVDQVLAEQFRQAVDTNTIPRFDCWSRTYEQLAWALEMRQAFAPHIPRPSLWQRALNCIFPRLSWTSRAELAQAQTRAAALSRFRGLCGLVDRGLPNDWAGFNQAVRTLLTDHVDKGAEKAARLWGVSDRAAIASGLRFQVRHGSTDVPMTIAGLGVVLEIDVAKAAPETLISIDWTIDDRLTDGGRTLSDYVLLSTVGLTHELMCHALDDPQLPLVKQGSRLHGWMSRVQLADLSDWARRGDRRLSQVRERAAQHGNIGARLNGDEQEGWRAAEEWHDTLGTTFRKIDVAKLHCSAGCRYPEADGLTSYSVLHVLTRWAVRKKHGTTGLLCDRSGVRLESGKACHRVDGVGRSLRGAMADAGRATDLVSRAETVLELDLGDWK